MRALAVILCALLAGCANLATTPADLAVNFLINEAIGQAAVGIIEAREADDE